LKYLLVYFSLGFWNWFSAGETESTSLTTSVFDSIKVSSKSIKSWVFISDTQAPLIIEKCFLKTKHNEQATTLLLQHIKDQKPSSIFFLGDVVNLSYLSHRWKKIDAFLKTYRLMGIELQAAIGNHEYLGPAAKGELHFKQRFPDYHKTGNVFLFDSVAILALNSNFSKLSSAEIMEQDNWYQATLLELNANSKIAAIIVCCHHSPYSNSKITGSTKAVQNHFLPLFFSSPKTRLFLSGHSHDFEYFEMQSKSFVVIGGGGGPHHPLRKDKIAQLSLASDYNPWFHYLQVSYESKHLKLQSITLSPNFSTFYIGWQKELIF